MSRESNFIITCIALFSLFPLLINGLPAKTTLSPSPLFMAPGNCRNECGGITFQYPFGIGSKGCYLNDWYKVVCNNSSGKPVPFLPKINSEVVNFSLPSEEDRTGVVHVKSPVISSGCSSVRGPGSPLNVTGSPFFIRDTNHLVAVGCNTKALITGIESQVAGCESSCGGEEESQRARNDVCSGHRCCQARPPVELPQVIGVSLESLDGNTTREGGCRVAFFTNQTYSPSNVSDPEVIHGNGYSVVELGWLFDVSDPRSAGTLGCVNFTETNMADYTNSCVCDYGYYFDLSFKSCYCNSGYRGNPYISDGCKDIDECEEEQPRNLCGGDTCKNIAGHFRCDAKNYRPMILGTSLSFGLLGLFALLWGLYRFIRRQRRIMRKKRFFKRNGGLLLQQQLTTTKTNVEKTRIFNSKELEKATDNFSKDRELGHGGQGTVYKGMLQDGRIVAVKRSKVVDEDKVEEFINEVVVLTQINHRHVVKLLGCCLETDVPVLVYEFVPNGDLSKHLRHQSDEYILTWEARLRIAIEIGGALSYLHSAASFPIYHRDIKPNNILLDEKYRAKVSDFGTSRSVTIDHTHLTTIVAGTIGYMDPEYFRSGQFTDKSDVYSFGVVLAELITGKRPVSLVLSEESKSLATDFIDAMKEKRIFDIVDATIKEECNVEQVKAVAELAKRCLSLKAKKRPTMREVSVELERIRSSPEDNREAHVQEHEEDEEDDGDEATEINISDSWRVDIASLGV